MSQPTTRQLLPRAERQAAILRGAAKAFAESGFADTSMEDVAAASGITRLIVYRHFESKEELYRAVLQQVTDRITTEFLAEVNQPEIQGAGVRTLLKVARDDPYGFVLLWRHAAREPRFAEYAVEIRTRSLRATDVFLQPILGDPKLRRAAAQTMVSFVAEAVLTWLEEGTPKRDAEFLELITHGVAGMYNAWKR